LQSTSAPHPTSYSFGNNCSAIVIPLSFSGTIFAILVPVTSSSEQPKSILSHFANHPLLLEIIPRISSFSRLVLLGAHCGIVLTVSHTTFSPISHSQTTPITDFELLQVLVPPKHSTRGPPPKYRLFTFSHRHQSPEATCEDVSLLHLRSTNHICSNTPRDQCVPGSSVHLPPSHSRIISPRQPQQSLLLVAHLCPPERWSNHGLLPAPVRPELSPARVRGEIVES